MKYGILPTLTDKQIYFADIKKSRQLLKQVSLSKLKLKKFFSSFLETFNESKTEFKIYKEMLEEYDRLDHFTDLIRTRISVISKRN